jgi:putative oxidoreductase
MRIVLTFTYWTHGAQKFAGWFGGFGPDGGTADLGTRFGVAGIIEFSGGILLMAGLFTQPVAFIASGEMAAAYFLAHAPRGFWPWTNGGEIVVAYCFVFLFLAFAGPGAMSLDGFTAPPKAGIGDRLTGLST